MNRSEQEMERVELTAMLDRDMLEVAEALEFEGAARLRDRIKELKQAPELSVHAPVDNESRRSGVPSSAHRRRDS